MSPPVMARYFYILPTRIHNRTTGPSQVNHVRCGSSNPAGGFVNTRRGEARVSTCGRKLGCVPEIKRSAEVHGVDVHCDTVQFGCLSLKMGTDHKITLQSCHCFGEDALC